jgi:hypothetical protein
MVKSMTPPSRPRHLPKLRLGRKGAQQTRQFTGSSTTTGISRSVFFW